MQGTITLMWDPLDGDITPVFNGVGLSRLIPRDRAHYVMEWAVADGLSIFWGLSI